ncbi:protein-disulfide reductase DsbD [Wenzhouxiangella sediminis]|uniref:Thiol:disulfide interchange protein DsbD n=1 Tax=Wenzhouxiangella sediminis TaxID=1792836 RepID=A0A3E1K930_9GAMM|nr:protein-disulfide reductase DsbD [Wenzhouxiangella sediminis]RFF30524.1 protein-disulfide reductase DsbD [Wenzhouxiangella sediminis]
MTKTLARFGALIALLWALPVAAQVGPDDLLPVEQAFALEASADDGELVLHWEIAEGYYLYRHAFRIDALGEDVAFGDPEIPAGEPMVDEFFGETETYRGAVTIRVPVEEKPADGSVGARVAFQGCADLGVCYPPHRQDVRVALPAERQAPASVGGLADTGNQESSGSALDALLGRQRQALPAEEAFRVEAIADGPRAILVRATARPDYYLYRHSFAFRVEEDGVGVAAADLPEGEPKTDEHFGETRVYFGEVEIPVELSRPAGGEREITLVADFQGCLDEGICYPPMTRRIAVTLPPAQPESPDGVGGSGGAASGEDASAQAVPREMAEEAVESVLPRSEQDRLAAALAGRPVVAMGLFLVAGLLLAFTPCVFPMVPILSGLIAGEGDRMTTGRAFRLSLAYVLAMALVYTLFGIVAGLFGQNLQAVFQHPAVLVSFAALFVVLSLAMFGFYELQLPSGLQTRLNEMSNRAEGGTLIGAAVMGALSALIVGPCVAPALMGALIYIGQTGDAVLGGLALFAMAMGMGIPLMIWGTSAGKLLPRAGGWMNAVKAVFGVGLLALAIWMLERVLPGAVIMLLWGALAIACGVYLGALTRLEPEAGGWRKLWQALGVMLLVFGIAQFAGALSGGRDWTRPLHHLVGSGGPAVSEAAAFRKVQTLEELQSAIAESDRPVFLDFYADWCVDCVRMDRRTFTDPDVARRLQDFTLLKADITANNDEHREMLRHFGLIGPPAYLFFVDGEELEDYRMFGFLAPEEFLILLDEVAP